MTSWVDGADADKGVVDVVCILTNVVASQEIFRTAAGIVLRFCDILVTLLYTCLADGLDTLIRYCFETLMTAI